jgi:hypothetical protein
VGQAIVLCRLSRARPKDRRQKAIACPIGNSDNLTLMLLIENPLNASPMVFPVLECFHIVGMAVLVGSIALVDFRVLGWGMRRQTASALDGDVKPWSHIGLAVMLLSGPMLFLSDPDMYYLNWVFDLKMVLLLAALGFNFTVHRKMIKSGGTGKAVAWTSLLLWASVIFCGIFIAFV